MKVEVVYEAQVSEELREAALKLMLPPNFYRFLNAPPCPGCVGCEPDPEDEETAQPVNSSTPIAKASTVSLTSTTTTVSQPFTFSLQTTSSTTVSQPSFTFSLNSLSSGHGSAEPKLSSVATTGVSQPFTFTVKTTTSSVGSTESKVSSVTSSSTPLFSTPSSASPVTPLFGASSQAVTSSSFLSGTPFFQSPATKPTFGTPVTSETSSSNTLPKTGPLLFGTSPATQSATTLSFGNSQVSTPFSGGSVFSQTTKESSPLNNTTPTNTQSPASVFGSPTVVNDSSKTSSFFSNLTSFQSPQTSVFGGSSPQANTTMFGTPIPKSDNSTSQTWYSNGDPTFLFKPTTSFSEIAASGKQPPFEADKTKSNFTWAGAGLPVFGGKTQPAKKEDDSGGESGGEEGDADTSHDPVFEPIVPLPDAIEVRTGEEDEDIVFCQRAKFYRYDTDTKEWKERGIGNMKILRHKKTKSIRLLLRREQVHKVVCNQLIMADMELQSLANSDKAFCWAAMNMAEEYSEPRLEKVAVRFKNADQAREFKINVEECIDVVKIRKENPISDILDTSSTSVLEPSIIIEKEGTEESEGEVEEAEYGEEYEPFFKKRATLHVRGNGNSWVKISQGELSINFQNDDASLIILFKKDDGNDMAIAVQSEPTMEILSDKEVLFYGQDYDGEMILSDMKEFKADFCTSQASSEFLAAMNEVMELSHVYNSDRDSEQED